MMNTLPKFSPERQQAHIINTCCLTKMCWQSCKKLAETTIMGSRLDLNALWWTREASSTHNPVFYPRVSEQLASNAYAHSAMHWYQIITWVPCCNLQSNVYHWLLHKLIIQIFRMIITVEPPIYLSIFRRFPLHMLNSATSWFISFGNAPSTTRH